MFPWICHWEYFYSVVVSCTLKSYFVLVLKNTELELVVHCEVRNLLCVLLIGIKFLTIPSV